ncbi:hypothetical protein RFI_12476, partial [Reticulomyxa filosa]
MDTINANLEQPPITALSLPFKKLASLPVPLSCIQCIVHKNEIIICGGYENNDCYSYDISKDQYKRICSYPNDVRLRGHSVVKRVDNEKSREIVLLSFGGLHKHTLMMRYRSVWEDEQDDIAIHCNKWYPFTNNANESISIGRDEDIYIGMRAVIGGSNNHLLFISYYPKNLDVFNLITFQFVKHDTLPTHDSIGYHCFVSKAANGLQTITTNKIKNEM